MDLSMGPHFSITSASLSAFDTIAIIFLVRDPPPITDMRKATHMALQVLSIYWRHVSS